MEQSQSGSQPLRVWLSGLLRSSHALLFCFGGLSLLFFYAAQQSYPIVAYGAAGLFAVSILVVVGRFALKGPERDHALPAVTFANNQFQLFNIPPEVADSLVKYALRNRRPLPPPTGIIEGSASDMSSIRILPLEEAKRIADEDERDGTVGPLNPGANT